MEALLTIYRVRLENSKRADTLANVPLSDNVDEVDEAPVLANCDLRARHQLWEFDPTWWRVHGHKYSDLVVPTIEPLSFADVQKTLWYSKRVAAGDTEWTESGARGSSSGSVTATPGALPPEKRLSGKPIEPSRDGFDDYRRPQNRVRDSLSSTPSIRRTHTSPSPQSPSPAGPSASASSSRPNMDSIDSQIASWRDTSR